MSPIFVGNRKIYGPESSDPAGLIANDEGSVVYNTTDDKLKAWDGSAWNALGGSSGSTEPTTLNTKDIFGDGSGVALYQFDGNSQSTSSASFNGSDGSGISYPTNSKYGTNCIDFDNSTNGHTTPNNAPVSSYPFTISLWAQHDGGWSAASGDNQVIVNTDIGGQRVTLGLVNNTGWPAGIHVMYGGTSHFTSHMDNMIAGGTNYWHHIVWSISGSANIQHKLWIDGHRVNLFNNGGGHGGSAGWNYGANQGNTEEFDGRIDQLRIINREVDDVDVLKLYNEGANPLTIRSDNTLKIHYDFSDANCYAGSGTVINNLAPNGSVFTGTVNGASFNSSTADRYYFDFGGQSNSKHYISTTTDPSTAMTNKAVTMECWVNIDQITSGENDGILSFVSCQNDPAPNSGASISVDNRGTGTHGGTQGGFHYQIGLDNPTASWTTTGSHGNTIIVAPLNQWMHVCATYDGRYKKVYLNGKFISYEGDFELDRDEKIRYNSTTWSVGRQGSQDSRYFDGQIAIVRVYDSALSAAEVANNFIAEKDRFGFTALGARDGSQANPFTSIYDADEKNVDPGSYYFSFGGTTQQLYVDNICGARHILVASSNAASTTIPGGTARNDLAYTLNRNGTSGDLGTPSPDSDYIIGGILDSMSWTTASCKAWGRGVLNGGAQTWANKDLGTWIETQAAISATTGSMARRKVWIQSGVGLTATGDTAVLDGVKKDSSLNANANQSTVGYSINNSGDNSGGTYLGHGTSEGSYEGWYSSAGSADNCQGYTTWIR
ncbi:hypothetical protein N231010_193 [Synechococcus phage S-CAM4]|uniref:LamG-like jellyroll fold domain-containing protein n=1 Tax=Synechococcus phage S-CAM4 TaxID=1883367 RepID=A0A1D8KMJ9_9CAUD|nr:hypothetical protein N231010_193 [Synechococcus phage S-CAM4]